MDLIGLAYASGLIRGVFSLLLAAIMGVSGAVEEVRFYDGVMVVVPKESDQHWGLTLGGIVFLTGGDHPCADKEIRHEIGHLKQEQLLGPLYLLLVGIPSLAVNFSLRVGLIDRNAYYSVWPESWADELGGVVR